jgi:hypothetical protein
MVMGAFLGRPEFLGDDDADHGQQHAHEVAHQKIGVGDRCILLVGMT